MINAPSSYISDIVTRPSRVGRVVTNGRGQPRRSVPRQTAPSFQHVLNAIFSYLSLAQTDSYYALGASTLPTRARNSPYTAPTEAPQNLCQREHVVTAVFRGYLHGAAGETDTAPCKKTL